MIESNEPATTSRPAAAPTDKETREVQTVLQHFDLAKRVKESFARKWPMYWKLALSNHWPDTKTGDLERSRPVIQKTHQAVETRLAHLTSRKPSIRVFPSSPDSSGAVALLQLVMDAVWEASHIDTLRGLSVRNTLVVGVGCLKVLWDGRLAGGRGDVSVTVVDPHHVFVSPGAINEEECDYIIHAQNITMGQLRRMYHGSPEVAARLEYVKPGPKLAELSIDSLAEPVEGQVLSQVRGTDGVGDNGRVYLGPARTVGFGGVEDSEYVTVYEEWSRRDDGRLHVRVVANDVLLDSYESPYNDTLFPFVFYRIFPNTVNFWSPGIVSVVAGLQLIINRLYSQVLDIMRLTSNPILLVPYESQIDINSIKVKPGLILGYNAGEGTRPSWLVPGPLPGEVFASIRHLSQVIDEVLGNQEILQGSNPPGVEAARALEALASQAGIRVEREAQWLEMADRKLGRLLVSRIQQFYRDERSLLITGPGGGATPVTLNQTVIGGGGVAVTPYAIQDADVQIHVEIGPSLPAVRLAEFQKTVQLAALGLFGPAQLPNGMVNPVYQAEIFKAAMHPNYKKVMEDVQAVMMAAVQQIAQMRQAQEAAGQGGQNEGV